MAVRLYTNTYVISLTTRHNFVLDSPTPTGHSLLIALAFNCSQTIIEIIDSQRLFDDDGQKPYVFILMARATLIQGRLNSIQSECPALCCTQYRIALQVASSYYGQHSDPGPRTRSAPLLCVLCRTILYYKS